MFAWSSTRNSRQMATGYEKNDNDILVQPQHVTFQVKQPFTCCSFANWRSRSKTHQRRSI